MKPRRHSTGDTEPYFEGLPKREMDEYIRKWKIANQQRIAKEIEYQKALEKRAEELEYEAFKSTCIFPFMCK